METNQLTTDDLQAMVLTASAELAARWLFERDNHGADVRPHLLAGAGVEVLVQLAPTPAIGLRLVDSDGSFVALRSFVVQPVDSKASNG
jgi:hypothetical protein